MTAAGAGAMAADVLLFSGTGAGSDNNWTMTADLAIQSYNFTGYTGHASDAGFILTVNTAGTSTMVAGMTATFTGIFDVIAASHTIVSGTKQLHRLRLSTTGTVTLGDAPNLDELIINAISGTLAGSFGITLRSGKLTRLDVAGTETTYTIVGGPVLGAHGIWNIAGTAGAAVVINGAITGAFNIDKQGAGFITYTNGADPTHVNTTCTGGSIRWFVPASGNKSFGSGSIIYAGGTFGFNGNASAAFTLLNAITVGAAGGTLNTDRQTANNPVHNINGAISLGGTLTLSRTGGSGDTNINSVWTIEAGAGTRRIVVATTNGNIDIDGNIVDAVGNTNGLEVQNNTGGTNVNLRIGGVNRSFANGLTVLTPSSGTSGIQGTTADNKFGLGNVTVQTGARVQLTATTVIPGNFTLQGTAIFIGGQTVTYSGDFTLSPGCTFTQGTTQLRPTTTPVTADPQGKTLGVFRFGALTAGDKTINLVSGFASTNAGANVQAIANNLPGTVTTLDCGAGTFTVTLNGSSGNPGFREATGTRNATEFFTVKFGATTWQYNIKWNCSGPEYVGFDYSGCTIRYIGAAGSSAGTFRPFSEATGTVRRYELLAAAHTLADTLTWSSLGKTVSVTEYLQLSNGAANSYNISLEGTVIMENGSDLIVSAGGGGAVNIFWEDMRIRGAAVDISTSPVTFGTSLLNFDSANDSTITTNGLSALTGLAITQSGSGRVDQLGHVMGPLLTTGLANLTRTGSAGVWDLNGFALGIRTGSAGLLDLSMAPTFFAGLEGAAIMCHSVLFNDWDLTASAPWALHVAGNEPVFAPPSVRTVTFLECTGITLDALSANVVDGGNNVNVDFGFGGTLATTATTAGHGHIPFIVPVTPETIHFPDPVLKAATVVAVTVAAAAYVAVPPTIRGAVRIAPVPFVIDLEVIPPVIHASVNVVASPLSIVFAVRTPFVYALSWKPVAIPVLTDYPPVFLLDNTPSPTFELATDPNPTFELHVGPP